MRHVLTVLLPIFVIGCSDKASEPNTPDEPGTADKLNTVDEPRMVSESQRKARVQGLIKQLADESRETRQAAYSELRDTFVRKRDIPGLTKEVARNANPEVTKSLRKLIAFMEGKYRLPGKGWTGDIRECHRRYQEQFEDLGCDWAVVNDKDTMGEHLLTLDLALTEVPIENRTQVVSLILTLEPESLTLFSFWANIAFVGTLVNLEKLDLRFSEVNDLTPLKGMPHLRYLELQDTRATDLKPLKGMPQLESLGLRNTEVADLAPLKGMPRLRGLSLRNTKVTDLTPLKGLPVLKSLDLRNSQVTNVAPLKGLPSLRYLYLQNTKVTDLTPLKGMPDLQIHK